MLALSVPALAYLLQLSLASLRDFANIVALFHPEVIRDIAVCLLWMLAHHVLAGVRHCLHAARINCWAALAVELGLSSWGQGLSCERPLSGARAWIVQRVSAVYMLGFVVFCQFVYRGRTAFL